MCRLHVLQSCGGGCTGDKLEVNVVFEEGFLHGVGALVVEDEESGGLTILEYVFMSCCPGCSDLRGLPVFEKVGVDGVGVVVVEDRDVFILA